MTGAGPNDGRPDLAVIGAGSAGVSAAITAAGTGASVALIGHGALGGTCVNVGCVPSKALLRAVEPLHLARSAARFEGIEATAQIRDWSAVMAGKQALVETLRQAKYADVLAAHPRIIYIEGAARFGADASLRVAGRNIRAGRTIIATGARPRVPALAGLADIDWLDSTAALEMTRLPRSLLVIGGGPVGVELGQLFARAGVAVTIVARRHLLPETEPEIGAALAGYFRDEGIGVETGLTYASLARVGNSVELRASRGGAGLRLRAERLLLATGRLPNTGGLGLEEAGIETDAKGAIRVDRQMRTSHARVWAAGDVTGRDPFVYMAAYGARLAALNALEDRGLVYDNTAMPRVVFCDPQMASVGLTEAEARARGLEVSTSLLALEHVPRALAARDRRGLIKLVAETGSRRLLGAHLLAPEGADSIQAAAMALSAGLTHDRLGEMLFPYLTTVEGLKLAAQAFEKDVSRLSCCAG